MWICCFINLQMPMVTLFNLCLFEIWKVFFRRGEIKVGNIRNLLTQGWCHKTLRCLGAPTVWGRPTNLCRVLASSLKVVEVSIIRVHDVDFAAENETNESSNASAAESAGVYVWGTGWRRPYSISQQQQRHTIKAWTAPSCFACIVPCKSRHL